ncbi:MAG: hypothetical protein SXU28_05675 [Pseudomonadota bacterium]|nr:hypothetical protein [Pseudomonadota bacterium]
MSGSAPSLAQRFNAGLAVADSVLSRNAVWFGAVFALVAFQIFLILSHQPWADEYQALLIATQAQSQAELLEWLRYEGHPPAWYWLLQALGTGLAQSWVLPAAALICAAIVQGVILFASPFTRLERLLLSSSQYVLFEFLTIARGTSLGVALMTLCVMSWRTRWVWLLIAMLPLVDFLFGVISGVFVLLQWRAGRLWWAGVVLWLAGGMFAAWTVIPAPDMISASQAMQMARGPMVWFTQIGSLPLPFQGGIAPQWNTPVAPIAGVAWIAMGWLCWALTRGHVWHRLMIFGFFGFTLLFSIVIYPIGLRHLMLGAFLLIVLVWLQRVNGDGRSGVFAGWLVLLALCGIASGIISTTRGFDSGDAVITEIKRRGLSEKHWIALPEWRMPAIAGRSAIAFARPGQRCSQSFVRWNFETQALFSRKEFERLMREEIAMHGRAYLLSDRAFTGFDRAILEQIAVIPAGYNGIEYFLYTVGKDAPEKSVKLPKCSDAASLAG